MMLRTEYIHWQKETASITSSHSHNVLETINIYNKEMYKHNKAINQSSSNKSSTIINKTNVKY